MNSIEELRGAEKVVDVGGIEAGEEVVVVSDWRSAPVAERVAAAAAGRDATVTMTLMDPTEHSSAEPPPSVARAVDGAAAVFSVVHTTLSHSEACTAAREGGCRWITVPKFTPEMLVSGPIHADLDAVLPMHGELVDRFTDADEARVTSDAGTDLTVSLAGRDGAGVTPSARKPGSFGAPGALEATIGVVEGTANGTIVADGAIPDLDVGALDDEVVLEVEDGAVVSVDGGHEAATLERAWAAQDTDAVFSLAQLAVGMNPAVREFDDGFLTAHTRYGNVHFGIGTSEGLLGGDVRAPMHFDVMLASATLSLDGTVVLEGGSDFRLG